MAEDDHVDPPCRRVFPQPAAERQAVDPRDEDFRDEEVRPVRAGPVEGLLAVTPELPPEARLLQEKALQLLDGRVALDDQNERTSRFGLGNARDRLSRHAGL